MAGYDRPNDPNNIPQKLQLTPEEKAVLLDCRRNAVYFRGIPLGILSALVTQRIVSVFVAPKFHKMTRPLLMGVAFFSGTVVGISTYSSTCVRNLLALENSPLADSIRGTLKQHPDDVWLHGGVSDRRFQSNQLEQKEPAFENEPPEPENSTQTEWSNAPLPGSRVYESDQTVKAQNDLIWDTSAEEKAVEEPPRKGITYEELRQKHRASQQQQYRPPPPRQRMPLPAPQQSNQEQQQYPGSDEWTQSSPNQSKPPRRNQYGDIIE